MGGLCCELQLLAEKYQGPAERGPGFTDTATGRVGSVGGAGWMVFSGVSYWLRNIRTS